MSPTTLKLRSKHAFVALAIAVLCLLPIVASAQPQFGPDLRIENFSVYSTMVERDGFRRMSVSFVVVNRGRATAGRSTTRVMFDNSGFSFATPSLVTDAKAYMSRQFRTSATELAITVQVDAFNNVSGEERSNNELKHPAQLNQEAGRWQAIGPSRIDDVRKTFGPTFGVGRVTTIAVDPRTPAIVYLGARGSGIWKSSGSLWFPIGDALPSLQIDAIGIYPRNPNRVVVATSMGVFESMDGGDVWTQLTSENLNAVGSGGGALLIENADKPALYVSTTNGLRVSTDAGRTWPTVLRAGARIVSLQFSTRDPSHLLASAAQVPASGANPAIPPAVFEAKDRGLTSTSWRPLTGCVAPLPVPFPIDANVWITESGVRRWVSVRGVENGVKKVELWRSTNRVCLINGFTEHAWEKVSLSGDCADFANHFSYLFAHPTDRRSCSRAGSNFAARIARATHLNPSLEFTWIITRLQWPPQTRT